MPRTSTLSTVLLGLVFAVFVTFMILSRGRQRANITALCAQYYAEARSAADSARVDRRIVAQYRTTTTTCASVRRIP